MRVALSLCDVEFDPTSASHFSAWGRAAAAAEIFKEGVVEQIPSLSATLQSFFNRWENTFAEFEQNERKVLAQHTSLLDTLSKSKADLDATFIEYKQKNEELTQSLQSGADGAIKQCQAQVDAIRHTYNEELALQAPTTYWKAKQVAHRWISAAWAIAFGILAGASVVAVGFVWDVTAKGVFDKTPNISSYGLLLPTIGAAFLAIWILRIISRQLLANLSLSSDAGERVSMVKTFLALMQMPDHVREPDRVLILSALFRPTLAQSDDGAPPSWFDLVMQRINSK